MTATTVTPQALIAQLRQTQPQAAARAGRRLERGVRILEAGMVEPTKDPHVFTVRSESNHLGAYRVDLQEKTCTCPDSGKGNACKHRVAAWLFQKTRSQEELPDGSPHIRLAGKIYPVHILKLQVASNGAQFARLRSYQPQDCTPLLITLPIDQTFISREDPRHGQPLLYGRRTAPPLVRLQRPRIP